MAVQQYTSHMSGIVSAAADNLVLGEFSLFLAGLSALLSFIAGAAGSAILISWGRRLSLHSEYALPLLFEALLLLALGVLWPSFHDQHVFLTPVTVLVLCFIMGLQNAIITKLSKSRIRTTHVTGIVTDIGIEIGKFVYWNSATISKTSPVVRADREKLALLSALCALFFCGGGVGSLCFKSGGFRFFVFLAFLVFSIAIIPIMDDFRSVVASREGRKPKI